MGASPFAEVQLFGLKEAQKSLAKDTLIFLKSKNQLVVYNKI
jgi:hypothetical protein